MAFSRSGLRNINFYDAMHPDVALGGLCQNGSITEENFLSFLEILLVIPGGTTLCVQARACGHIVTRVNTPLATGSYDLYCDGMYSTSGEMKSHKLLTATPHLSLHIKFFYLVQGLINNFLRSDQN